jgi:hypothetical protein
VPAVGAAGTGETVGEDAALEVAAEVPLGYRWRACSGAILLKRQPGGKVRLHGAIEQGAFGLATAVDGTARSGAGGGGRHGSPGRATGASDCIYVQLSMQT